jgi:glycosyltransferase involved in cell wall biosynthesis
VKTVKHRVLIASNPLDHEGGVVNYYRLLLRHFQGNGLELVHHPFGSRARHFYRPWKKRLLYPAFYAGDFARLAGRLLLDRDISVVQVSPSLIPVPLVRDGLVLLFSKLLRRKVVVFYRGWKKSVVSALHSRPVARWLFRSVYNKADVSIVLAERFGRELLDLGVSSPRVEVMRTMYDAGAVLPFSERGGRRARFLFLGRVSHLKGMRELVHAAGALKQRGYDFTLTVVGHGDREGAVGQYRQEADRLGLSDDVSFRGRLIGDDKWRVFAESDVFVLPSWTEGCPTSVLEALGSGLFAICTDVGALPEIIRDGNNGRLVRARSVDDLTEAMAWALDHIEDLRARRRGIQADAFARFDVHVSVQQFRALYRRMSGHDIAAASSMTRSSPAFTAGGPQ